MSENHLSNILGLLRLIKNTEGLNTASHSAATYLQHWAAPDGTEEVIMRVAGYVLTQITGSEAIIRDSDFVDEGKAGLLEILAGLRTAFSLGGLQTALRSYLPALDTAISQFALVVSIMGKPPEASSSSELADLIDEIEAVSRTVEESNTDEFVKGTVKRHLHVLLTLLRNLDVMGVDAAMAAYAELVIRLQSIRANAPPETKAEINKFWPAIEEWSKRLGALRKIFGVGSAIAGYGKPLLAILKNAV